jgi:hypothetical protein
MELTLSPEMKITRCVHPWPHIVIDNFLSESSFAELIKRLVTKNTKFKKFEDDPEEIQFTLVPDMKVLEFFLSEDIKKFLGSLAKCSLKIYEKGIVQLRKMDSESPAFPPHSDFIDNINFISLYYLSPDWSPEKGGELLLHRDEFSGAEEKDTKWITPLQNRMVLFFSEKEYWHSVRRVQNWERYLIFSEWEKCHE